MLPVILVKTICVVTGLQMYPLLLSCPKVWVSLPSETSVVHGTAWARRALCHNEGLVAIDCINLANPANGPNIALLKSPLASSHISDPACHFM